MRIREQMRKVWVRRMGKRRGHRMKGQLCVFVHGCEIFCSDVHDMMTPI